MRRMVWRVDWKVDVEGGVRYWDVGGPGVVSIA